MKTLIELYKSIQASVGMVSDSEGFVSTILPGGDTPKPLLVDSKRVVLPTDTQLKQPDWSSRIGFHPLLQNVAGGESRVLEKFRERMNAYADFMLGMLLVDIAQLGIKKDMHKDLTPEQAAYLGPFSDSDAKFVKLLTDLVGTKRVSKKNAEFIRFSVIKGRVWQGQKRSRVAVCHFPLYELLPKDNKPTEIAGHKLRIADVKMLRNMYEFLFTGIREPGFYEVGSDSKIAPSLEALMALYGRYTEVQNQAVSILEPVINTANALLIVNDWRDDFVDLTPLLPEIRKIPLLEGNAPTERIAQAHAPVKISDSPMARTVVGADVAPMISASMVQTPVSTAQAVSVSAVQQQQPAQHEGHAVKPRFKLGVSAPTVEHTTHHITDQQAKQVAGLSYHQPPLTAHVPVTPPVGSLLAAQQPPQQQMGMPGNVLPGMQAGMVPMQQQMVQQQPVAMKVPESARLFNGQLYIPVEAQGVSTMPPNAMLIDGKVYIPLNQAQAAPGMVPMGQPFNPMAPRMGMPVQAITDPAQIPGLSEAEIQMYRGNPVMFQNYLSQMHVAGAAQMQQQQMQRQTTVPRYLRSAVETAQQNQFASRGFFNGR
jgi:hypothetical protein